MTSINPVKKIPHILLADDDINEGRLFNDALANLHVPYVFSFAKDGEMLLNMLDEQDFNPDFIFLDLHRPGISGEDCLEAIKSRKRLNAVPIILYSGSVNPDDRDYCYKAKANEYFLTALFFLL